MNMIKRLYLLCLLVGCAVVTAVAQVPGSALDYMLQRPRVTKFYKDKTFLDHLFVDAGIGVLGIGPNHIQTNGLVELNIGDWFSPEHGMRLHVNGGTLKSGEYKAKYVGVGFDYLINLTALSHYGNAYSPRPVEVYGVAGVNYNYSRRDGVTEHGLGVRLGLRGQVALSPFTYFYLEPRIGIMDDNVSQQLNWHGYRPTASLSAGLGYRLPETHLYPKPNRHDAGWADGFFIGLMGGPTALLNSEPSSWKDQSGVRLAGSLGKWFGTTHGLRLSLNGNYFKQLNRNKVKAVGAQLDYLINLHNAFGGYNPDRRFWFNALAGLSYNYSSTYPEPGNKMVGFGAGLQANLRLSKDIDFVLEPRVDVYGERYAFFANSFKNRDVMGAVMAGLVYTYHDSKSLRANSDPFNQNAWFDHAFVETGVGVNIPIISSALKHPADYARPSLYLAVGKWFSSLHGVRLWGQMAQTQFAAKDENRYKHAEVGVDYLLNLTNALYGYRAERRFDVMGALGANVIRREENTSLKMGLDASLRATWHPNRLMGIFIEPRLQGYGDNLLPSTLNWVKLDLIAAVQAGVSFNINANLKSADKSGADDDLRSSIMIAGGLTNHLNQLGTGRAYSPVGKLSYTHWYSQTAAWRYNLQGYLQRAIAKKRQGQVSLGIDWMGDLTAASYGYDPSRVLSVSAFVGANVGVDFGNDRTCFAPDVHVGSQLSLRVSDAVHLNLEPQIAYQMSDRWTSQSERIMPQVMLGLEYSMKRHKGPRASNEAPSSPNVVMAGVGVGTYSGSFGELSPYRNKLTFNADLGYGRWLSQTSGAYVRFSNLTTQRRGEHNQSIHSLQAGYMLNVKSAVMGESTENEVFQLTTLLGALMNVGTRPGQSPTYAPGVQMAVQAGVRVTPKVEVYLEPSAAVFGKTIEHHRHSYAAEGMAKLSLGTKINF